MRINYCAGRTTHIFPVIVTTFALLGLSEGILRRCFTCRSRGDLGSCKDPFRFNSSQVENERGVEAIPCASGWCGKFLEGATSFKEDDYGIATQRLCLQRGPSDSEERCAYTVWNYKKVYMCFCQGDLCNTASNLKQPILPVLLLCSLFRWLLQ